jgi:hypothetical protein
MVVFDTEAWHLPGGRFDYMTAYAIAYTLKDDGSYTPDDAAWCDTPGDLWQWITDRCTGGELRCWAHNLEFDLAVSRGRHILPSLGWRPDERQPFAVRDHGSWWRWRRPGALLVQTDSMGFLGGMGVDTIAKEHGLERPALPDSPLDVEGWRRRCQFDAWVVGEALRRVIGWLDAEDGGSLALTGASQGMTLYRKRFLPERTVLCDPDEERREAEREAVWAGRCEAWRVGEIAEPLVEWDFENAYPRIAEAELLPVKARHVAPGAVPATTLREAREAGDAVLARVRVDSDTPVAPAVWRDRIVFPVGRWEAWLWDPELDLLASSGAGVEVLEARPYVASPVLHDWAVWILEQAGGHPSPMIRSMAKQWSRTVIGSFGLRYPMWELFSDEQSARSGGDDIRIGVMVDGERAYRTLDLSGTQYVQSGEAEGESSAPSVMGYVWSRCRVMLWEAMLSAGLENVVYVDTDSLIVTRRGDVALRKADIPFLRVKGDYTGATIYGPRQLILKTREGRRRLRVAGAPRDAKEAGGDQLSGEVWTGLNADTPGSTGDAARMQPRLFRLGVTGPANRRRAGGGMTREVRI